MSRAFVHRRYLTNFQPQRLPHLFSDVLIVGSGAAGLRAAIEAAQRADVLLVTKDQVDLSASSYAQGGVAAALPPDTPAAHAADTLATGCGLSDARVVELVTSAGPGEIERLLGWGAHFDTQGGRLAGGLEGAHSAPRIIHAQGDATGREIVQTLWRQVRAQPRIRVFEHCFTIDVLTHQDEALGAVTFHPKYGHQMFWAAAVVLATGGPARVFREHTAPPVATGDGLAMALRAGAVLRDLEMVQFHPTTLYVAGAARVLISEAVRGEGALLLNRAGRRFMPDYDPRAELAPRDVVSRAMAREMKREHSAYALLDVRHFPPGAFAARFPNIARYCREFDIDPQTQLIPVRPAAHYGIGGVATDDRGRTNVPGLLACGEVASTGLHGANRLASNSLLECLVFGARAGAAAAERAATAGRPQRQAPVDHVLPASTRTELDLPDVLHSLQSLMSRNVALERDAGHLGETIEIIEFWSRYVMDKVLDSPGAWEVQNLLTVALAITTAALARRESRGAHFRTDFPQTDLAGPRHIDLRLGPGGLDVVATPL
ncbi:MAG: L-aspartate oxidase [Phycisphaerae bacterium]|nr:L-aspartate oxidase [Phycisphaerae bacterium]MCZ2401561.1 L-aspartate oxidase [Phycisphaerae bacterium]